MILNTFIKINKLSISKPDRSRLGISLSTCFRDKYPDKTLKKVSIKEKGVPMMVFDYPRWFLESKSTDLIIVKLLKKQSQNV